MFGKLKVLYYFFRLWNKHPSISFFNLIHYITLEDSEYNCIYESDYWCTLRCRELLGEYKFNTSNKEIL